MEARSLIQDKPDIGNAKVCQTVQTHTARDADPTFKAKPRLFLSAVSSAVLLWACYFPLAWGWLAWVALVPLLCLVRSEARAWKIYGSALLSGLIFFWAAIQWMRVADIRMYATWAMLATYCALYFPVTIGLLRLLDRGTRWPLTMTLPVVWCGLEFLRSFLMTGFAWYYLGHSQHAFLPLIQVSDLGGAYTVSFLVAAVNGWLFEVCFRLSWLRSVFRLPATGGQDAHALALQGGVVVALIAGALGYGIWRLNEDEATPGPRVALLQGNLDQRLRIQAMKPGTAADEMLRHYMSLGNMAVRAPNRPDLIVWPETSFPIDWVEFAEGDPLAHLPCVPGMVPGGGVVASVPWTALAWEAYWQAATTLLQERIGRVGPYYRASVLLGLNAEVCSHTGRTMKRYCSGLLVRPNGTVGGRYDKMHRVPFGEYVPLRDVLPFMERFAPYDFDYSITPGTHFTRFAVGPHRFGTLICFEDTDPYLARQYMHNTDDGRPVDFLVDISNDGWFDGSSEHGEHLAICRFRAIETRRAVARAVNMGISAVIDSNGRVLAPEMLPSAQGATVWQVGAAASSLPVSDWQSFKKVAGVLMANIPVDHRESLYARWGDWLGWGCLGLAAAAVLWFSLRRRAISAKE
jgi:apolipoprotein N-acyltransferase